MAALLLYIVSLPTLLFAQFVYNINLMILLCAGTMLCFARYVRTGRVGFGAGYALLGGLALAAKPNAAVVLDGRIHGHDADGGLCAGGGRRGMPKKAA